MISIGSVWDRTTGFLSDNLAATAALALAGIFIPLAIWYCIAPFAGGATAGTRTIIYAGMLLLSLWAIWGKLAIIALSLDPVSGGAARMATRRLGLAVLASLTVGIAFALLGVPVLVALGFGGYDFATLAAGGKPDMPSGGSVAFILLYIPLVMIALIFVWPRLALIAPVVVSERRGLGAIMHSVRLTRGVATKIFGVLLLYIVVSQVALLATRFVFGSLLRLAFGDNGPLSLAAVLTAILVAAVATVFAVLAAAFTAKLYLAVNGARERAAIPL